MTKPFTVVVFGGRTFGDLESLKGDRNHHLWPQREREYQHVQHSMTRLSLGWPSLPPDDIGNSLPNVKIVTGGAPGADRAGIDWAVVHWCPFEEVEADWDDLSQPDARIRKRKDGSLYDANAGPRRNQKIIDEHKPDVAVEFPGGLGTSDMRRRLDAAGIPIERVGWE